MFTHNALRQATKWLLVYVVSEGWCLLTTASGGGSSLTWVLLALLEGFEDVDEGEVVSRRVLELHEAPAGRIRSQAHRGSPETAGC